MGRASSAKKVARAARAGGGRRAAQRRNLLFPGSIALVMILGVLLVVVARNEAEELEVDPIVGEHWHAAYGIYNCDEFAPPLNDAKADALGIHTHADGVVHIHPFSSGAAGRRAQLKVFADQVGLQLDDDGLQIPGGDELEEGDQCGDEEGIVQVARWESPQDEDAEVFTENLGDIRFRVDRELFTIAFAPEGADIPKPPSVPNLDTLTDLGPEGTIPGSTSSTEPTGTTATSTGDPTTTSAGAGATSTTQGAATSTTAGAGTSTTAGSTPTSSP